MTPTPDTTARTETAETVTVPRKPTPEMLTAGSDARWLRPILNQNSVPLIWAAMIDAAPALSPQHPVGVREAEDERDRLLELAFDQSLHDHPYQHKAWAEAAKCWLKDNGAVYPVERKMTRIVDDALSHPPAQDAPGAVKAEEERDALLQALGFKPGPFGDDLSRKVILEDAAGLRPAMVKAREAESRAEVAAASAAFELDEIRAELLAGQGDDDGPQILPDFEEGQTVLQMVCKCIALLETRRDIVGASAPAPEREPTVELMQRVWANLYFNEADAGYSFQHTLNDVVDWLAARNALPSTEPQRLPEADGEVVAWMRTEGGKPYACVLFPPFENWETTGEFGVEPLVRQSALVSALRERDEARQGQALEDMERRSALRLAREATAAREKAEQVAAGLRELVKRGKSIVDDLYGQWHFDADEALRASASTEEGKTATPSVKQEEAGRG